MFNLGRYSLGIAGPRKKRLMWRDRRREAENMGGGIGLGSEKERGVRRERPRLVLARERIGVNWASTSNKRTCLRD